MGGGRDFDVRPEDVFPPDELEPVATLNSDWASVIEAVVMVVTRARQGSGLLIAPDVVLTAHHVLPDESALAHAGVRRGMHGPDAGTRLTPRPSVLFRTSQALDYTVFSVAPVAGVAPLDVDTAVRPCVGQGVRVLGHRDRRGLEVSGAEGAVQSVEGPFVEYTADTEDGMSGGPVLSTTRRLLALHHFGDEDCDLSNRGVLITAIREDMR